MTEFAATTAKARRSLMRRDPVFDVLYRDRNQPVADDRAVPLHAVEGDLIPKYASLHVNWYAVFAAHHPDVHSLVLLGFPRQSKRDSGVPLAAGDVGPSRGHYFGPRRG